MELDGRTLEDGTTLEADVCVVGAGPAGLTLAAELAAAGRDVLLLESGGHEDDPALQALNEGTIVGDPYVGLRQTRHRQIGGTAHTWNTPFRGGMGAKYVPLDPHDFRPAAEGDPGGWPFPFEDLVPFYRRAHDRCGLGRFEYRGEAWADDAHPCFDLEGTGLETRVYHFGPGEPFTRELARDLRESGRARLCRHATAVGLRADGTGRTVAGLRVRGAGGATIEVAARIVVLAGGAVENARLLLTARGEGLDGLAENGWIGRCFMEHPRDYALTLFPHAPDFFRRAAFYDAHEVTGGGVVCGRIALGPDLRLPGLPNASVTLLPRARVRRPPGGLAGRVVQHVHALGGRIPEGLPARALRKLHALVRRPAAGGYGWSGAPEPSRRFDAFRVLLNLEQRPHPENRIVLGDARDALGLPRPVLHWRWRDEEQAGLVALRRAVARGLEQAGLGRVEIDEAQRPDPNAHHHAGTTRMHPDPRRGATDADGRVHGMENLYGAGASLFPTAGFANPMLTIVALSLRLADHLAEPG